MPVCPYTILGSSIKQECSDFSDQFTIINPEKWQEVLFYSRAKGTVALDNGKLVLAAPSNEPCEIQVYSLFSFAGDFDIQIEYDLSGTTDLKGCSFNAGLVLQTENDEQSYKCYVATKNDSLLFFRTRLDRYGETKIAGEKLTAAPSQGMLRVTRDNGIFSFFVHDMNDYNLVYTFDQKSSETVRLRLKLQTSIEEGEHDGCLNPEIAFDNFTVNSCTEIISD